MTKNKKKKIIAFSIFILSFAALTGAFYDFWAVVGLEENLILSTSLFMAGFLEIFIGVVLLAYLGY